MDRIIPAVLGVILLAMAVAILAVKDRMSTRATDWRMVAALFVFIPVVLFARQSGWVTPDMGSKAVWVFWGAWRRSPRLF